MTVDISRFQRSMLDDAIRKARELQARDRRVEAAQAWEQAASHADLFAKSGKTSEERHRREATAIDFRAIALKLRGVAPDRSELSRQPSELATRELPRECEFLEAARRLIHKSTITFDQIAGLEHTQRQIQSAYALALASAPAGVEMPIVRNILFYGPPGCGKTLLAAAVSNGLEATFFSVKVGDLLSRYYGDSPKLVQALYDEARSHGNAVVFLDEFDALGSGRDDMDNSADRRLLVSLLTELDGMKEKDRGSHVMTIAATNMPWVLDEAILSRFERSIHIPLPDAPARRRMLELQLTQKGYSLEVDVSALVQQTNGLSGREIEHLCKMVTEEMINDANPALTNIALRGRKAMQSYSIQLLPISQKHLDAVRPQIRPVSNVDSLRRFENWTRSA